jgi:hypothetical protein
LESGLLSSLVSVASRLDSQFFAGRIASIYVKCISFSLHAT